MTTAQKAAQLEQVTGLLPYELRRAVLSLSQEVQGRVEEIRLRGGSPLYLVYPTGEEPLSGTKVDQETLRTVLEIASQGSAHTVLEQVRHGFVAVKGGHRLGLCGSGVVKDGVLTNLRTISSLALRVARPFGGLAGAVLPKLFVDGQFQSTLILSPPGWGKTTLLRDVIGTLSRGDCSLPLRMGVADERGEIAALWEGQPAFDMGPRTDVMDGCPKDVALMCLLRGMNPQVLAVDEITDPKDVAALGQAAGCGVQLLATAHGGSWSDLQKRPLYRTLMAQQLFDRFVIIALHNGRRHYQVLDGEGGLC